MRVLNYASYARAFELGVSNPNMTKIAQALFEPIVNLDGVFNRAGNPYTIDSKQAKAWYDQTADIPTNLKNAAGRQDLNGSIGAYFADNIVGELTNPNLEPSMYSAMLNLVKDSELQQRQKDSLLSLYNDGMYPDFLGATFLLAVVADNMKRDQIQPADQIDTDLQAFWALIRRKYPKPKPIIPPEEIQMDEIPYVQELYRVYHEVSGDDYVRPEDLNNRPKLRRNFDRQRKDYYLAETIRHELRDTIRLDEAEGFDILKDEVYEGVITTRDKDYNSGFDRMTAVMEQASIIPLSYNLMNCTLDWVGAGEKKGVCHMLVNDNRLSWMENEDAAE